MFSALLALLVSSSAGVPHPARLIVRTQSDASLPCQADRALIEGIQRRLPGLEVVSSGSLKEDDLSVSVWWDSGTWHLEATRADGSIALSRIVHQGDPDCADLATTSALIVDRFLAEIGWPGRPVVIGSLDAPPPQIATRVSQARALEIEGLFVSVGGGADLGIPLAARPGLAIDVATRIHRRFRLSLWFFLGSPIQTPILANAGISGSLWAQTALVSASGALCHPIGRVEVCEGLQVGAAIIMAGTTGPLFRAKPGTAALPSLGAFARLTLPLPLQFEAAAEVAAVVPLGSAQFYADDRSTNLRASVTTPAVDALATLRLGRRFF